MIDIRDYLTKKQLRYLKRDRENKARITLLEGSVGSGKTLVLLFSFLLHVKQYAGQGVEFIIGGATIATIHRNFLGDLERISGIKIKLDKHNSFKFLGNKVWCFEGKNNDAWKKLRGMNSAGTLLGELTTLNKRFVNEAENRTRKKGARLFYDTNPDHEGHWVQTTYIHNSGKRLSSGRMNIYTENFKIEDNTYLPSEYVESLKATTPPGVLYDRNILGLWTSETMASIYGQYLRDVQFHRGERGEQLFVGIDLGIRDSTSLVFATMKGKKLYILDHYMNHSLPTQHYIDFILQKIQCMGYNKHSVNIILPHDSAKREDSITFLASRFRAYSDIFPCVFKLPPIRVMDNINTTRYHLHNKNIYFEEGMTDLLSRLRLYSWKIDGQGNIDSTQPDHGIAWDAPSNVADSFEYLVFHTLGIPDFAGGGSNSYYQAKDFRPYDRRG